jgi:hypothetical protein
MIEMAQERKKDLLKFEEYHRETTNPNGCKLGNALIKREQFEKTE